MSLHVDEQAGALYLGLSDATIVESTEVHLEVILYYDERGEVVGIELQCLKNRVPEIDLHYHEITNSMPRDEGRSESSRIIYVLENKQPWSP